MCDCGHSHSAVQSLEELDFERGLWYAAQYGDLTRIIELLQKGRDVNGADLSGYTPLHYASRNGHLEACRILIERGACLNVLTKQGRATAMHRAATAGKLEVVKLLLSKGADYTLLDSDGKNVLHRAAQGGHLDICELLLDTEPLLKTQRDQRGNKPLDYCKSAELATLLAE